MTKPTLEQTLALFETVTSFPVCRKKSEDRRDLVTLDYVGKFDAQERRTEDSWVIRTANNGLTKDYYKADVNKWEESGRYHPGSYTKRFKRQTQYTLVQALEVIKSPPFKNYPYPGMYAGKAQNFVRFVDLP